MSGKSASRAEHRRRGWPHRPGLAAGEEVVPGRAPRRGWPPELVDPPAGRRGRAAPGLAAMPAGRRGRAAPPGWLPLLVAPSGGRQGRPPFSAARRQGRLRLLLGESIGGSSSSCLLAVLYFVVSSVAQTHWLS